MRITQDRLAGRAEARRAISDEVQKLLIDLDQAPLQQSTVLLRRMIVGRLHLLMYVLQEATADENAMPFDPPYDEDGS